MESPPGRLSDLRSQRLSDGRLCTVSFGGAFYAIMYLLPQFVQTILHYDPVKAGVLFTPSTLVLAILVPIVGKTQ
ncbi:MAG: hypothetical protein MH219_10970 [Marinobacter sp.]|nr:hypothetical protein [Marinobacter sp.]